MKLYPKLVYLSLILLLTLLSGFFFYGIVTPNTWSGFNLGFWCLTFFILFNLFLDGYYIIQLVSVSKNLNLAKQLVMITNLKTKKTVLLAKGRWLYG
jgi:hypothetical protein